MSPSSSISSSSSSSSSSICHVRKKASSIRCYLCMGLLIYFFCNSIIIVLQWHHPSSTIPSTTSTSILPSVSHVHTRPTRSSSASSSLWSPLSRVLSSSKSISTNRAKGTNQQPQEQQKQEQQRHDIRIETTGTDRNTRKTTSSSSSTSMVVPTNTTTTADHQHSINALNQHQYEYRKRQQNQRKQYQHPMSYHSNDDDDDDDGNTMFLPRMLQHVHPLRIPGYVEENSKQSYFGFVMRDLSNRLLYTPSTTLLSSSSSSSSAHLSSSSSSSPLTVLVVGKEAKQTWFDLKKGEEKGEPQGQETHFDDGEGMTYLWKLRRHRYDIGSGFVLEAYRHGHQVVVLDDNEEGQGHNRGMNKTSDPSSHKVDEGPFRRQRERQQEELKEDSLLLYYLAVVEAQAIGKEDDIVIQTFSSSLLASSSSLSSASSWKIPLQGRKKKRKLRRRAKYIVFRISSFFPFYSTIQSSLNEVGKDIYRHDDTNLNKGADNDNSNNTTTTTTTATTTTNTIVMNGLDACDMLLQAGYRLQILSASHHSPSSSYDAYGPNTLLRSSKDVEEYLQYGANLAMYYETKKDDNIDNNDRNKNKLSKNMESEYPNGTFRSYIFATMGLDLAIPSRRVHLNEQQGNLNVTVDVDDSDGNAGVGNSDGDDRSSSNIRTATITDNTVNTTSNDTTTTTKPESNNKNTKKKKVEFIDLVWESYTSLPYKQCPNPSENNDYYVPLSFLNSTEEVRGATATGHHHQRQRRRRRPVANAFFSRPIFSTTTNSSIVATKMTATMSTDAATGNTVKFGTLHARCNGRHISVSSISPTTTSTPTTNSTEVRPPTSSWYFSGPAINTSEVICFHCHAAGTFLVPDTTATASSIDDDLISSTATATSTAAACATRFLPLSLQQQLEEEGLYYNEEHVLRGTGNEENKSDKEHTGNIINVNNSSNEHVGIDNNPVIDGEKSSTNNDDNNNKNNLLVVVLNQVSAKQFEQFFPKTIHMLENELKMVRMKQYTNSGTVLMPRTRTTRTTAEFTTAEDDDDDNIRHQHHHPYEALFRSNKKAHTNEYKKFLNVSNEGREEESNTNDGHYHNDDNINSSSNRFPHDKNYRQQNKEGKLWLWEELYQRGYEILRADNGCFDTPFSSLSSTEQYHGDNLRDAFCYAFQRPNCVGNVHNAQRLFRYSQEFIQYYDHKNIPWAAFVSLEDGQDDTGILIGHLDEYLSKFVEKLSQSILSSTSNIHEPWQRLSLVVVSEQPQQQRAVHHPLYYPSYGSYFGHTYEGIQEMYQPLLYIKSTTREKGQQALHYNQNLFVTPYDVYATLRYVTIGLDGTSSTNDDYDGDVEISKAKSTLENDKNIDSLLHDSSSHLHGPARLAARTTEEINNASSSSSSSVFSSEPGLSLLERLPQSRSDCTGTRKIPNQVCDLLDSNSSRKTELEKILSLRMPSPPSILSYYADIPRSHKFQLEVKTTTRGQQEKHNKTQNQRREKKKNGPNKKRRADVKRGCICATNIMSWRACAVHPWGTSTDLHGPEGEVLRPKEYFMLVACPNKPVHLEIRVAPSKALLKKSNERLSLYPTSVKFPNIIFLELDSVSVAYADRTFPKTRELLRKYRIQAKKYVKDMANENYVKKRNNNNGDEVFHDSNQKMFLGDDEPIRHECPLGFCSADFSNRVTLAGANSIPNQVAALAGCVASRYDEACGYVTPEIGVICNDTTVLHHGLKLERIRLVSEMLYWCPEREEDKTPWLLGATDTIGYVNYFGEEFCYEGSPYVTQGNVFPSFFQDIEPHKVFCRLAELRILKENLTIPDVFRWSMEKPDEPCIDGFDCNSVEKGRIALDMLEAMWETYKDRPRLAFLNAVAAHDYNPSWSEMYVRAERYDDHISSFIETMLSRDDAESTIIIIRSDHGLQRGPTAIEYSTQVEHTRPWTEILVPANFPHLSKKVLYHNQHRLTNGYDIYHTLRSLIDPRTTKDGENTDNIGISSSSSSGTKLSEIPDWSYHLLLDDIPENRTCEDARSDPELCRERTIPPNVGVCNKLDKDQRKFCRLYPNAGKA